MKQRAGIFWLIGLLVGLLAGMPVQAEEASDEDPGDRIYRSRGADGAPVFSDRPPQDGRPVEQRRTPRATNVVPAPSSPRPPPAGASPPSTPRADETERLDYYQRLAITSPEHEATLRHPVEPVPVTYELEPGLLPGHQVRLLRNGEPEAQMALDWPHRGAHELVVEVRDAEGKVLKRSAPVTVFVHRPSALLRPGASRGGNDTE
ncbi:DUF4124 domain-containing protein [Isoalcanivorax indicus]|uniref:DUF4124 domain-containing protein n=1 Tax=Isoalcanivorax indicus TaxID=2202653 RepID=UPI0013C4A3DA|nr:DUF4124 domain-containing protein [Isoalcanivorax indicus]